LEFQGGVVYKVLVKKKTACNYVFNSLYHLNKFNFWVDIISRMTIAFFAKI